MITKKKDMKKLHDLPKFGEVVKRKNGLLQNYEGGGLVDVWWGWNDEASLDQMIAFKVKLSDKDKQRGYKDIVIDWQELYHYARGVSMSFQETERRIAEEAKRGLL